MCLTKDEKYLELREAINSLDDKAEVIEIQNVAKDNIITDIMNKFVVGNPRVWWLAFKRKPKSFSFDDEFQEGVSKCTHPLFYAQSPDFLKPGFCYFLKFLYL